MRVNSIIKTILLPDEAATLALGKSLAPVLRAGDIILLRGGLGAGKTSLARGIITSILGDIDVPSPTYTLVQTYETSRFEFWHFDLYRLENPSDIWELGIEDAFGNGVCLIEWPMRIESLLSGHELCINIIFEGDGRRAEISGPKAWEARLARF